MIIIKNSKNLVGYDSICRYRQDVVNNKYHF